MTVPEHPDVATLRKAMDAFTAGDIAALGSSMSPDVLWRIPGTNKVSGEFRGVDATVAAFGRVVEESAGTYSIDVKSMATDGTGVVSAQIKQTGIRGEHIMDDEFTLIVHVHDGRITDARALVTDLDRQNRFWS